MKVLITGSSGYLGQHFLHTLIKRISTDQNCDLTIYATYGSMEGFKDNVISSLLSLSLSRIYVDQLDLKNSKSIQSYFESNGPFDICFHLAAMSSPKVCQCNHEYARDINVPLHLFDALENTAIVALSTDQVYCGQKAPYSEDNSKPDPVNVYAQTKLDMEKILLAKRIQPTVCLRSSIILGPMGPFGGAHSTFLHFCQSREGIETTFFTDEIRSVISVSDVVQILLHYCDTFHSHKSFASGVYNMGGPDRVSRMEMAIAVAKECRFAYEGFFIPVEKAKLNLSVNDDVHVPSPIDISMDSSKLEQVVGWKFSGLEATVRKTFSST